MFFFGACKSSIPQKTTPNRTLLQKSLQPQTTNILGQLARKLNKSSPKTPKQQKQTKTSNKRRPHKTEGFQQLVFDSKKSEGRTGHMSR